MSTVLNPHLLQMAKQAFVDPATAAGGGPGMDPSAAGMPPAGGMPMDPAMMGGMPPGGMGAPPADPLAGLQPLIQQAVQQAMAAQGGAAGGAVGGIKPKIDVNVALMQMSKMLARICSALSIHVPPEELIATPQDLGSMAQQQSAPAGPQPTVQPIQPMAPAMPPPGQKTAGWKQRQLDLQDMVDRAEAMRLTT